jgi:two-component system, OmpR family, sensor histidine kinase KdpD
MFSMHGEAKRHQIYGVFAAIVSCAAITLVSLLLVSYLAPLNIVMLYLLGVVCVALFYGRISASISAIINVGSFDFFFISPHFSFAVHDVQYLLTFLVMLLVGLLIGQLTAWARAQAQVALMREERANHLFEMAKALSSALTEEEIFSITKTFFFRSFHSEPELLLPDQEQKLYQRTHRDLGIDFAMAQKCFLYQQKSGAGIELFSESALQYVPLATPSRTLGVIVLEINGNMVALQLEQQRLVDTYALLIASALERLALTYEAEQAKLHRESERLRNTLLAALSHDLRTPLTILFAQAEMLTQALGQDDSPRLAQANAIRNQVLGTTRLVNNLLDMARLESAGLHLRKEWQSMQEIIGSALSALSVQLTGHPLTLNIPMDVPLVFCDAVLIERVLVNLLENASKYAGQYDPIGLDIVFDESNITTTIWNFGSALPKGKERQIFDKFSRGEKESTIPGVGLGLSICKAIIETHGGRIWAENRNNGVHFSFTIPAQTLPELEPELANEL